MSDVTPILTSRVDIKRFTAFVLDNQVVAISLNPSRPPVSTRNSRMEVSIQGSVYNNGLVSISGNVVEQIPFIIDGVKVGVQNFNSISGITISGISGGNIKIRCVSDMGQPINQLVLIGQNVPSRFYQNSGYMKGFEAGQQVSGSIRKMMGLMLEPNANIENNDYVYGDYGIVGITVMQVNFWEAFWDFDGLTHHIEANLQAI